MNAWRWLKDRWELNNAIVYFLIYGAMFCLIYKACEHKPKTDYSKALDTIDSISNRIHHKKEQLMEMYVGGYMDGYRDADLGVKAKYEYDE